MSIRPLHVRRLHEIDAGSTHPTLATGNNHDAIPFDDPGQRNSGLVPGAQMMVDMGALMQEMSAAGVLLDTAGLRPSAEGARLRLRHGKPSMTDGPFTESKQVIGDLAILQAGSHEEAVELTRRFLGVHGDDWDIECESRQIDEPALPT